MPRWNQVSKASYPFLHEGEHLWGSLPSTPQPSDKQWPFPTSEHTHSGLFQDPARPLQPQLFRLEHLTCTGPLPGSHLQGGYLPQARLNQSPSLISLSLLYSFIEVQMIHNKLHTEHTVWWGLTYTHTYKAIIKIKIISVHLTSPNISSHLFESHLSLSPSIPTHPQATAVLLSVRFVCIF